MELRKTMKYLEYYKEIHATQKYGEGKNLPFNVFANWCEARKVRSILDYGAGQSPFAVNVGEKIGAEEVVRYDPAIKEIEVRPDRKFDVIFCTDVLEHIPEEELGEALSYMRDHSKYALIVIHTGLAKHKLSNGENAHVTVKGKNWWQQLFSKYSELCSYVGVPDGVFKNNPQRHLFSLTFDKSELMC